MAPNLYIVLIATGFLAGILSGLLGIGGGIVLVPMLMVFAKMSQHSAQGTSLGALLLPVGILAAWKYHQNGHLNIRVALIVAVALTFGAYFGAIFASQLDAATLKKVFGAFLIFAGAKFLFF